MQQQGDAPLSFGEGPGGEVGRGLVFARFFIN